MTAQICNPPDWIRAVWRPPVGCKKVWHFLTQQFNCCTFVARCASALSYWNIKLLPDTLRIAGSSMTSLRCHKTASKKLVKDITRISCFVTTMQLVHCTHCKFIQQFLWRSEYAVAFFKVVQQKTIGEAGNSITCLWTDNFCLQQWKNY